MTNYRKQLTAKTAWARITDENRRMKQGLETIAELAGSPEQSHPEITLRRIRQTANAALGRGERKAA
jgi:hypothetical protein